MIASQKGAIDEQNMRTMPSVWHQAALRLAIIHRLAVLLNRSRSTQELPQVGLRVDGESLQLAFPSGWLDSNPLTVADLQREQQYLQAIGYGLEFV